MSKSRAFYASGFLFCFAAMAYAQTSDTSPGGQLTTAASTPPATGLIESSGLPDMAHLSMGMVSIETRDPRASNYFKQAYVSFCLHKAEGLEIDAGEFVTSAGAETIETYRNFNYSRSLLFTYAIGKKNAVAARLEYFDDVNGFNTGTPQSVKEYTLTHEYKLRGWLMTRAEFRTDWSNKPFFERNNQPNASKTQPTVTLGLIAYVMPKK
jgi:hypothetical protein